jgi:uncharacterized membrane protein
LEFGNAPHQETVLSRYPQVGVTQAFAEARTKPKPQVAEPTEPDEPVGPELPRLVREYPFLRRHPHPMTVHFPIVFSFAAAGFSLLYLLFGWRGFELTALNCLGAGVLFTPVAMITGYFTWKYNYMSQWIRPVIYKMTFSSLLLLDLITTFFWRLGQPGILDLSGSAATWYLCLVLALAPLVALVGWFGAMLTFPLHKR